MSSEELAQFLARLPALDAEIVRVMMQLDECGLGNVARDFVTWRAQNS